MPSECRALHCIGTWKKYGYYERPSNKAKKKNRDQCGKYRLDLVRQAEAKGIEDVPKSVLCHQINQCSKPSWSQCFLWAKCRPDVRLINSSPEVKHELPYQPDVLPQFNLSQSELPMGPKLNRALLSPGTDQIDTSDWARAPSQL